MIVALSSCFVQRGEPACLDKGSRTEMALLSGADLVLELPSVFSCHNAGVFASGAVDILESTGVVGHLSFGMETSPANLENIIAIVVEEPQPFKDRLRALLDRGFSYVNARAQAAESVIPGAGDVLSRPNNSLAVAYMSRIASRGYAMTPSPILRSGCGYHQTTLGETFPSATAIREALRKNDNWRPALPKGPAEIVDRELGRGRCCLDFKRLWEALRVLLIRTTPQELRTYAEFGEGIEHRFLREAVMSSSWNDFMNRCVTGRYPRGRLQRNMIHFFLGIQHDTNRNIQRLGPAYIKPLGATGRGRKLLDEMGKSARLPVVTRGRDLRGNPYGQAMWNLEQRACDLWELLIPGGEIGRDRRRPPLMIYPLKKDTGGIAPEGDDMRQEGPYPEPLPQS